MIRFSFFGLSVILTLFSVGAFGAPGPRIFTGPHTICVQRDEVVTCTGLNPFVTQSSTGRFKNLRHLSVGNGQVCAVDDDGLFCWGRFDSTLPWAERFPMKLPDIIDVKVDYYHACVLHAVGISCWGNSDQGYPNPPAEIERPSAVAVNRNHVCVIDEGKVKCWGNSESPVLKIPSNIIAPEQIAVNDKSACVLHQDGLRCWGVIPGTVPLLGKTAVIAAGKSHYCALTGGKVTCWGSNADGQLEIPVGLENVKEISLSGDHSCAAKKDSVICWGRNSFGQLHLDLSVKDSVHVAIGKLSTCFREKKDLKCFGTGAYLAERPPEVVGPIHKLVVVGFRSCAIHGEGNLSCWSHLKDHGLQVPKIWSNFSDLNDFALIAGRYCVQDGTQVKCWKSENQSWELIVNLEVSGRLFGGKAHGCALSKNAPYCWGKNEFGQVSGAMSKLGVSDIAVGANHTCIVVNSEVECFGDNSLGQLNLPGDLGLVSEIDSASDVTCAVDSNKVRCWGDATSPLLSTPQELVAPKDLVVGHEHACVKDLSGVRCWGSNGIGQAPRLVPYR